MSFADERNLVYWWMILTGKNWNTQRKPCASVTSSTTNWSEICLEKNVRSGETILELWSCKTSLDSFHPARTELSIAAPFQRDKAITKDRIEFCLHVLLCYRQVCMHIRRYSKDVCALNNISRLWLINSTFLLLLQPGQHICFYNEYRLGLFRLCEELIFKNRPFTFYICWISYNTTFVLSLSLYLLSRKHNFITNIPICLYHCLLPFYAPNAICLFRGIII